ncbi:MAG: type II secretion system protein [Pseudomonadales bacterium]
MGNHKRIKDTGFTLIELVIVIVILGILAATALPRFLDVTDDAEAAAVEGMGGGLASAVAIAHARWVADGNSRGTANVVITLEGTNINMNENGWPANTGITGAGLNDQNIAECQQVWDAVLQNPPSTTTLPADRGKARYHVTTVGSNVCRYEMARVPAANPPTHRVEYFVQTGRVTTTVPDLN